MSPQDIEPAILCATGGAHPLDVTFINEEDLVTPWKQSSTRKGKLSQPLPDSLTITLANLVYFEKAQLPQPLANCLIRLAAFQNPEFYRAQAMRMSVWDKPRVTSDHQIWFFTLYDKDEAADLTAEEKKVLRRQSRPSWRIGDESHETETQVVR